MGASLALAGLTACTRQPTEHIVPYVRQPEELIPGRPLFYATATTLNGVANGVLVESHEGRPTKIEGNPEHPGHAGRVRSVLAGVGAAALRSGPRADAHVRGRNPRLGRFYSALREMLAGAAGQERRGHSHSHRDRHVAHHGGPVRDASRSSIRRSKWHQWEPAGPHSARAGAHAGVRPAGQHVLQPRRTPTWWCRSIRISWRPARAACATRGSSRRGGACAAIRPP